jgi:hypothetical protein
MKRREPGLDGRLLLTPHVAWFSDAGRADLRRKSAATVRGFFQEGRLRNCVNRAWLGSDWARPSGPASARRQDAASGTVASAGEFGQDEADGESVAVRDTRAPGR